MAGRINIKRMLRSKGGFSLMELVAVITVIALLAAIIIPGYLHFIGEAKKDASISTARTIYLAAQMRATEFKAKETAEAPYRIPDANDLRDLVGSDSLYNGVTELTITDNNRDGTIDKIDLIKDGINVSIEPGSKVVVDGKERTVYDGNTK